MLTTVSAADLITLGQYLFYLNGIRTDCLIEDAISHVEKYIACVSKCGLHDAHAVARSLVGQQIAFNSITQRIDEASQKTIREKMQPISTALYHQASQWNMIRLNNTAVSERLRSLASVVTLNDSQRQLLDETIRCIECDAYRSAIITGWNLTFDFIRQWVFDNRLTDFNDALTNNYVIKRTNTPRFTAILDYRDFWEASDPPGERVVLDCCKDKAIIGGNLHQDLCKHLRQRNNFAHANTKTPTVNQANAYVDELVDIITNPPFRA